MPSFHVPRPETGQAQRLACGQIRQPARDGSLSVRRLLFLVNDVHPQTHTQTQNQSPRVIRPGEPADRCADPLPALCPLARSHPSRLSQRKSRLQRPGVGNGWIHQINQSINQSINDIDNSSVPPTTRQTGPDDRARPDTRQTSAASPTQRTMHDNAECSSPSFDRSGSGATCSPNSRPKATGTHGRRARRRLPGPSPPIVEVVKEAQVQVGPSPGCEIGGLTAWRPAPSSGRSPFFLLGRLLACCNHSTTQPPTHPPCPPRAFPIEQRVPRAHTCM
jgi:hypothetical protein